MAGISMMTGRDDFDFSKPKLPEETLEGDPARAYCHICEPVIAFKDIDAAQEHFRTAHLRRQK